MADRDELYRRNEDVVDTTDADLVDDDVVDTGEGHASTGGAMLAGAATGGVIGLAGGPIGAAVGAVGGAIVGAVTERVMHSGEDVDDDVIVDRTTTTVDTISPASTYAADTYATDTTLPVDTAPGRVMEGDMDVDRHFTDTSVHDADTLELREEQLTARKERVQAGEVEVGKRVVEEQRSIDVPVTREEVVIERHPVNRAATDTDFVGTESETIRVPVMEETVRAEKQAVVTEEINVGKRVTQDTERVSGTVRREEAVLNQTGNVDVAGGTADWDTYSPSYQSYWSSRYGSTGAAWKDWEPTYRFGHDSFYDARYRGRSWNDVEPDLRRDYSSRYGESAWEKAKGSLRDAWDNLFGRDYH